MKKTRMRSEEYLECDGCGYLMVSGKPMVVLSVPFDVGMAVEAEGRDWATVDFHFHVLAQRHDCFRYWAHNPRIMRNSLIEREFADDEIDDFMELMLYREHSYSPGIERWQVELES